jgi:hypothetical protein
MWTRPAAAALVGLLVLTACSAGDEGDDAGEPAAAAGSAGPTEDVPSALDDRFDPRLPEPLLDPEQIVSGGPPPDGIPPIDEPRFERADGVDWLGDREPVLSLTVAGESRAYPLRIMTWHEIVNDSVGGEPVAVTYCPLCNSGVAFERRAAGRVLTFGTSGLLYADNLVMRSGS